MLVIVVALFALCWLPLQTYNVLQDIYPEINGYRYINIIWFCCDWLAMSNSCYNPFIYGIYNEKFKREFRQRLRLCPRRWAGGADSNSVAGFGGGCGADAELSDFDKTRSFRSSVHVNGGGSFYRSVSMRGAHSVHLCPTGAHHHHHNRPQAAAGPHQLHVSQYRQSATTELSF